MHIFQISKNYFRVLGDHRLRDKDALEIYDAEKIVVDGVTFIRRDTISQIKRKIDSAYSTSNIVELSENSDDFSDFSILTNVELTNYMVSGIAEELSKHEGYGWYSSMSTYGNKLSIHVYKEEKIKYSGNIYEDKIPTMEVIFSMTVKEADTNTFSNVDEKNTYMKTYFDEILGNMEKNIASDSEEE